MRYGHWSTLDSPPFKSHHNVLCVCICGTIKEVHFRSMKIGTSKSCGCQKRSRSKHNMTETPTWNSWYNMMRRCYYKKSNRYYRYGDRGIIVCPKWHEFKNFFQDMGKRPKNKSIDRIDIDKNYEPSNCRWATRKQQMNNTSRNKINH